ncbi:Maf family nucleotide pyrophosphatase [Fulvivirgaceae bacterium BMA10]|uniref:dTTP/UTP pyrophosphatase n=1 Tax=Splendidivirga corallicola TaxID=3051826 RepID=A0ABT8KIC8_9BACT|nr:Maf family nucleotide pyrophosphatase [Fulvivirgaceae bacterium BMA10]
MNSKRKLILASNSPRRQQLLKDAGFDFQVKASDVDESFPTDMPSLEVAKFLAEKKALALESIVTDEIIIAADTIVIIENQILGKPQDKDEAMRMLQKLSAREHIVATGVCLLSKNKKISFTDSTVVTFRSISEKEIDYYIEHYKPYDKAGAYGIQEWIGMIGIEKINGSYFNVVGLPIHKVYNELLNF